MAKLKEVVMKIAKMDNGYILVALMAIGIWVAISWLSNFLEEVWARLMRSGKNLKKRFGKWGVVTGATDGIGFAYAEELCKKGLNVLLISRTQKKLDEKKEELEAKFSGKGIEIRTLAIDFSKFGGVGNAGVAAVAKAIEDLDVGVLVNNVGASYKFARYWHELDDEKVEELITLNILSTTWMTKIVLPGMIKKKKGAIVNIASAAGTFTNPLLAQYGAAKSYVLMFSKSLNEELASFGVHVQCQVPMFVATKLASIRRSSLTVPSPAGYARAGVAAIGYESFVSPYWSHAPYLWLLMNLPESVSSYLTMWMHKDIRRRGMKKYETKSE